MNLEVIDDGSAIEKGASKRKMSEKQLANLAAGRAKKAANAAERQASATADKVAKVSKAADAPAPGPVVRRKRTKQVIVFDDDSESENEAPQIVIKQKRPAQRALAPQPPPSPPPSPPPIPKLRRV